MYAAASYDALADLLQMYTESAVRIQDACSICTGNILWCLLDGNFRRGRRPYRFVHRAVERMVSLQESRWEHNCKFGCFRTVIRWS